MFWFQNHLGSMGILLSHEQIVLFGWFICWDLCHPMIFLMAHVRLCQKNRNTRNIPNFITNISLFMADMMINHMIFGVTTPQVFLDGVDFKPSKL